MTTEIAHQPPLTHQEVPTEGHILHVEAYPRDDQSITLHLLYSETPGARGSYIGRQFEIARSDAETLAKSVTQILASPDTQAAWKAIASDLDEGDHELALANNDDPTKYPSSPPPR